MDLEMSEANRERDGREAARQTVRPSSAASIAAAVPPAAHLVVASPVSLSSREESIFVLDGEVFFLFPEVRGMMQGTRGKVEGPVFTKCFEAGTPADATKPGWAPAAGVERFLRVHAQEGGPRLLLISSRAMGRWYGYARIALTDAGFVKYEALRSAAFAHLAAATTANAAAPQSPPPTSQPAHAAAAAAFGGATPATAQQPSAPPAAPGHDLRALADASSTKKRA